MKKSEASLTGSVHIQNDCSMSKDRSTYMDDKDFSLGDSAGQRELNLDTFLKGIYLERVQKQLSELEEADTILSESCSEAEYMNWQSY